MVDKYSWDESDLKTKSVRYLSLVTDATRIIHQRNPHTMIDLCSTNELVYELGLTFNSPRNLTFDRFQLITVQQNSNKILETFFSRLRELCLKCAQGNVEEDLIKDFFIVKMNNSTIQMELLSEVRATAQLLNFALSSERGQKNQREILQTSTPNWNTQVSAISNDTTRKSVRQQQPAQQTNTNKELCWRCGGIFTPCHITQCAAKQHNAASAKRQAILQKCATPEYLQSHNEETNQDEDTNVPSDLPKANSEFDKSKKT